MDFPDQFICFCQGAILGRDIKVIADIIAKILLRAAKEW